MWAFVVEELDVLQMMSPNGEGAGANGLSIVASLCQCVTTAVKETTHSWPVLRITSRILCFLAKAMPLAISEGWVTLIAKSL